MLADFSKPTDGTITEDKGDFKFSKVRNGKYKISVTFLGYDEKIVKGIEITDKQLDANLGKIYLVPQTNVLAGVEIVAEKDLIETNIDKITYNAEKDVTARGGDATEVLRKVPMVTVDFDGNVSLRGSTSVRILINGKPSSIMANSVADAMKMIPADNIQKVEVITNPSAKYDAEGTAGIINIITKQKRIEGMSGSVMASAGTRSSSLNGNLTFRSGNFGVSSSLGGYGWISRGNFENLRTNTIDSIQHILKQTGKNNNWGGGGYGQIGVDYDINERNNLTATLRGNTNYFTPKANDETFLGNTFTDLQRIYRRETNSQAKVLGYDASLDYKRTFAQVDREWTASVQFNNSNRNFEYAIRQFDNAEVNNYNEQSDNIGLNRELTVQTDYVHPFTKTSSLELGAKGIFRNVNSDYRYDVFDFPTGTYIEDEQRSNIFDYRQDVEAAYAQYGFSLKKWSFRLGTRYEFTNVSGDFLQGEQPFSNRYDNLLPNVKISYTLKNKNLIKLSYSQRVQRPSLSYLNPYRDLKDPLNISYGNPNLAAELSHNVEAEYNFNKNFTNINLSVYHRRVNNAIEGYRFVDANNVYVSTYANWGKNYATGASINVSSMIAGKLILSGTVNASYYEVVSTQQQLKNNGVNYNVNFFCNWNFHPVWGLQGFGNWNSPKITIQGRSTSFYYYSFGVRRDLFKKMGGLSFGVDNFLNPVIQFKNEYKGDNFVQESNNKVQFFGVRLSFDYRFGKMEFSQSKKKKNRNDDLKEGDGNEQGGGRM